MSNKAIFGGYTELDSAITISLVTSPNTGVPTDGDSTPIYRVYGEGSTVLSTGSMSLKDSGSVTGATNANPIVITSAGHGLTNGTRITISGVGGNTAANTTAVVANKTSNTFEMSGVAGNGTYTSGGTWHVSGLYDFTFTPTAGDGYEVGTFYTVVVEYDVSSTTYADILNFGVV